MKVFAPHLMVITCLLSCILASCGNHEDMGSQLAVVAGEPAVQASADSIIVAGMFRLIVLVNINNQHLKIKAQDHGLDVFILKNGVASDVQGVSNLGTVVTGIKSLKAGTHKNFTFTWKDKEGDQHDLTFTVHKKKPDANGLSEIHIVLVKMHLTVPGIWLDYNDTKSKNAINGKRKADYGDYAIWVGALEGPNGELTSFWEASTFFKAKYELAALQEAQKQEAEKQQAATSQASIDQNP